MSLPEEVLAKHRSVADDVVGEEVYGHLIGGEWVESDGGETRTTHDSTTGEALAEVQQGTRSDVDRAVAAAREAFEGRWGEKSPQQRADLLHEIADVVEEEKTSIARLDSLEVGKPNKHSLLVDNTIVVDQLRHFASLARTADSGRCPPAGEDKHIYTRREPYGVVGCISAWNFPAMFVAWKLGPALAAGNSVVYKPSSRAALSTLELGRIFDRVLPDGTVNVVTGAGGVVGDALTAHEDVAKVSLTGSTGAGQAAMRNAANRVAPVSLELGGNNPNIVFPDADLDDAVEGALVAMLFNQGQQCTAGSRLFVHEDVRDEFCERLYARLDELEVGDPLSPLTDVGPLVDHDHADEVRGYVETARQEGASVLYEGEIPDELRDAPFVPPTLLGDVDDDDTVAVEEVFGPVAALFAFESRAEVLARANDTEFGLAAAVWTTDLDRAHEVAADLEAGTVWVNTYNDLFEPAPYGGYKQSGLGRELAAEALDDYSRTKSVKMNHGDVPNLG
ncbi:aldehyde dehydrogenase family protein [Haloarchaeobius iranensis]|uniref:Aldehyde dehydrogenase (NAD+) n=1 Tax=Haloarchaeobius iranensis TaxID=996166 RepID=A0A1G9Y1P3_9EURY|nr:aldehyde dehydrogenase family protein [Haloarchaeobius iranensis]SDN02977.1 aldehyde dehydrogenase (NAD+) [Haloarchaeobius iranensis]